jgi:hypothetical protein
VEAKQGVDSLLSRRINSLHQPHPAARRVQKRATPMGTVLRSGYALPSVRPHRRSLILIVAGVSP